jgi:ADP-heptose:LPS heptosyltransferase
MGLRVGSWDRERVGVDGTMGLSFSSPAMKSPDQPHLAEVRRVVVSKRRGTRLGNPDHEFDCVHPGAAVRVPLFCSGPESDRAGHPVAIMPVNRIRGFYEETRGAGRLLVIDPGVLGDAVHLVPALRDLRRNYPGVELHTVSSPAGREVLEMAGCVDRQWILEQAPERRRFIDQARVALDLRRQCFDVSINLSGADRPLILAGVVGARRRLGWRQARWHTWSTWCVDAWAESIDPLLPVFEQRRRVLAAAGLSLGPADLALVPPPECMAAAGEWVPQRSLHVSVSASHSLKEWPMDRWIGFIHRFLAAHPDWNVVATGSPGGREQERLDQLRNRVGDRRLLFPNRPLGIQGLAAVLKRCRLHVGADSGALHLAASVGTPTVSLFRDYHDASSWMPQGPRHRSLSVPCACQVEGGQSCQATGIPRCLTDLGDGDVLVACQEILERVRPGSA